MSNNYKVSSIYTDTEIKLSVLLLWNIKDQFQKQNSLVNIFGGSYINLTNKNLTDNHYFLCKSLIEKCRDKSH